MEFRKSILKSEQLKKLKGIKKDQLLIFLLSGILLLVIAIPVKTEKEEKTGVSQEEDRKNGSLDAAGSSGATDSYVRLQEERLREVLQKVEGVGKAEVMITLQTSAEKVVEKDIPSTWQDVEESDSGGGTRTTREESQTEETVYQEEEDGSRIPYVVKELEPRVEGVIVIAQGGGDAKVRQNILEAVQALFSVEAHKIKIMKMEGST